MLGITIQLRFEKKSQPNSWYQVKLKNIEPHKCIHIYFCIFQDMLISAKITLNFDQH